ncbi:hypothetical protein TWF718_003109 [Orbilia javanica]|uniref:deoxyribose-phosphate aldolase n=1 Tax=Orbilia javanica TaxID=47235 RepID=A0AAN8MFN0_9PEZI
MSNPQQPPQPPQQPTSSLRPLNPTKPIPIFTPTQRLPPKPSPSSATNLHQNTRRHSHHNLSLQSPTSPKGAGLHYQHHLHHFHSSNNNYQRPISMQSNVPEPRTNEELTPLIEAHVAKVLEDLKSEIGGATEYTPDIVDDLTKPTEKLAQTIDHTLLKPEATEDQIKALCDEAIEYGFKSCCINPSHVRLVSTTLTNTPQTLACSVIGFPLGATTTSSKCYESSLAILDGAKEIDMVLPIGQFLQSDYSYVYNDIFSVVRATKGVPVKVIIETSLLKTQEQKIAACWIAAEAGAAWVKTSTGFNGGGATVEDVRLMRLAVAYKEGSVKVKASGGVRSFEQAIGVIKAGASRIGTSNGVAIMGGTPVKKENGGEVKKEEAY